jgi:hypothetical protein
MAKTSNKEIPMKRETFVKVWRQLAPDESFGGMSLVEFEEATEPAVVVRDLIENLKTQTLAALQQRKLADEELRNKLLLVIHSIRGAPAHGENSPMYRALGYVPKNERASGLTRKGGAAPPPPTDANAA